MGNYAVCKMEKFIRCTISFLLIAAFLFSAVSGVISPGVSAIALSTDGDIYCNVKFSKPAICCDAGQTIDLTKCAVQFSSDAAMTTEGITWSYEGTDVQTFTAAEKGVYALTAQCGETSKTIYVVAKDAGEEEYVLYRNDFSSASSDIRVVATTNGATVSEDGDAYILDGSGHYNAYVRVLLPEFLDAFGDAKMEAGIQMTAATDTAKWASMMFRVQSGICPYYQACIRYDTTADNGVELSQWNASNQWEVYKKTAFSYWNTNGSNVCSITARGTEAELRINGYDVHTYSNTGLATGAWGFQSRGSRVVIDYVEITLDGNDPAATSCDVSYAKPAIRADLGDTIDLTQCDVQFAVDTLYTSGGDITWMKDGVEISSFTPSAAGVTLLTAVSGDVSKNIYVVTRNLTDGEYVLYRNDFDSDPTDFRVIQQTSASVYHDGAGNYVIDASASGSSYGRVLLPSFLDEFGDVKFEARYKDTSPDTERRWASLMARVQSEDYPYMQMCIRYNAALSDGVEFSERNSANEWSVKETAACTGKVTDDYNVYSLVMQSNHAYCSINGKRIISYSKNLYVTGAMGLQARGLKLEVDYVKVTLGENAAYEDTAVKSVVSKGRPAIGCNIGQTVLLDKCDVQFTYGAPAVDADQIVWKKDGQVITQFSATTEGLHKLTATYGATTRNVYIVAKKTTENQYVLYHSDFDEAPTDLREDMVYNGGTHYHWVDPSWNTGHYVLDGSSNANAWVRVLLPEYLDDFGDATLKAKIKIGYPVDTTKWGSVVFRSQEGGYPYMQACMRYDATVSNGVDISERTSSSSDWTTYQTTAFAGWYENNWNWIVLETHNQNTSLNLWDSTTNGYTEALSISNTPYSDGGWGFQVRGTMMWINYATLLFTENNTDLSLYITPGNYAEVRDIETGITIAPSLITDVKTKADFNNILTDSPAIAIMDYQIVDGSARVVFSDGSLTPLEAVDQLGDLVIPAFRISDNETADSLAAFLTSQDMRDVYAVSTDPSVLSRAYGQWKYIRGVADYSGRTDFVAEELRYEALANGARVLILPETAAKADITQLHDSFSSVWLTVSQGKTASVAAINKGVYGIITPDRAVTEECCETYYEQNTKVRRVGVIGHRGNPSTAQQNTIASAKEAYALGATAVENDIYLVADGVMMVIHDAEITNLTTGTGYVQQLTSTQLKKYYVDANANVDPEPIPSLEEYLQLVQGDKSQRLVIEIKQSSPDAAFAQELKRLIDKYELWDQIVIIAFGEAQITTVRELLPGVPVGWLGYTELSDSDPIGSVSNAVELVQSQNTVCDPYYTGWASPVIQELAYRGITLWPWTIRNQDLFDRLMLNGVGGITTDYCQWSTDYVENLTVDSQGRVIATTYGGTQMDVTASAEFVVIEDTLGISCTDGVVNVPVTHNGGSASYFFRYTSTNRQGVAYDTVTQVVTVQGHSYDLEIIAPTCTQGGANINTCPICGDGYISDEVPALGHRYENGVCTVCGEVQIITVYFDAAVKGWDHVNAHYWNESGATTQWPGYAMTLVEGTVYSIEVPGTMTSIIFNDGTYQTEDLIIPADGYANDGYQWIPYGDSFTTAFYVTGDGDILGNWDADFADGLMANLGGGIFAVTFENVPGGTYEFKVTNGTWDLSWGNGEWNSSFTAPAFSNVTVKFNVNTNESTLLVQCLHTYEAVVTAPTCTEAGYTTYTCACGDSYTSDWVEGVGHNYEAVVTAPTCTEAGYTTYTCVCGDTYTADETAVLGHSFADGVCTACGAEDPDYVAPVVQPTITLKYPTLVFEDVIMMNVYFAASDLEGVVEMGLITYPEEVTEWNVDNANAVVPGYTRSEADGFYYATTNGIAAKDLGDEIYFAVYAKLSDGTYYYTRLVSYSPRTYAYSSLATGLDSMKPIVVAMLNYGAAAQNYFNYKTDTLVNADLTVDQLALVEGYRSDMITAVASPDAAKQGELALNGGYARRYPTVSFEGAFCINYYATPSAAPVDGITMYYWAQEDYDANSVLTLDNATAAIPMTGEGTGEYHAAVEGIAAKDLSQGVYVCFVYTDGTTTYSSGIMGYSIGTYCVIQAAKTGTLADLAAATAVYGYYANELFYEQA